MSMFQAEVGIPYHLMRPVYASGRATAVGANAEFNYAAPFMTVNIFALGTKLTIIPAENIQVSGSERIEIIGIQKYTGSTVNYDLIQVYQRADAHETAKINYPFIILKPGESIAVRIFNRSPAADATIQVSINAFTISETVWDKYVFQQRKNMEIAAEGLGGGR